jgi:hypothetical protein
VSFPLSTTGSIRLDSPGIIDEKVELVIDGLAALFARGARRVFRSGTELTFLPRRWTGFNRLTRILGGDGGDFRLERQGSTIIAMYDLSDASLLKFAMIKIPSLPAMAAVVNIVTDAMFKPRAYPFDGFLLQVMHWYASTWPWALGMSLLALSSGYLYKPRAFRKWLLNELNVLLGDSRAV